MPKYEFNAVRWLRNWSARKRFLLADGRDPFALCAEEIDRLKTVIKILEADIEQQESLLKPMADALREAIELLPRCSTTWMRTVIEQYEFITGDKQ